MERTSNRLAVLRFFPFLLLLAAGLSGCVKGKSAPLGPQPNLDVRTVIFAPHPDDEALGFAGLIYQKVHSGQSVKVVVVTDGDAYWDACFFWKNGFPGGTQGRVVDSLQTCSPSEMGAFAQARRHESQRAMTLLGLSPADLIVLGYPDAKLLDMYNYPDSVVAGNTSAGLSETGKPFMGSNLTEDLCQILRFCPNATVYTTHPSDHHRDHHALALFVEAARERMIGEQAGTFPAFWAVIHSPDSNRDLLWPSPECTWDPDWQRREERYNPTGTLDPPTSLENGAQPYALDALLWNPAMRTPPLLREVFDIYQTQAGFALQSGAPPGDRYRGCMDPQGLLLAFVRRNHLFWEARVRGQMVR